MTAMGEAGRAIVEREISSTALAKKQILIYEELIAGRSI